MAYTRSNSAKLVISLEKSENFEILYINGPLPGSGLPEWVQDKETAMKFHAWASESKLRLSSSAVEILDELINENESDTEPDDLDDREPVPEENRIKEWAEVLLQTMQPAPPPRAEAHAQTTSPSKLEKVNASEQRASIPQSFNSQSTNRQNDSFFDTNELQKMQPTLPPRADAQAQTTSLSKLEQASTSEQIAFIRRSFDSKSKHTRKGSFFDTEDLRRLNHPLIKLHEVNTRAGCGVAPRVSHPTTSPLGLRSRL